MPAHFSLNLYKGSRLAIGMEVKYTLNFSDNNKGHDFYGEISIKETGETTPRLYKRWTSAAQALASHVRDGNARYDEFNINKLIDDKREFQDYYYERLCIILMKSFVYKTREEIEAKELLANPLK